MSPATNARGPVVCRQDFDPWGAIRSGGISQTTLNYTGQRRDGTGVLSYHARYDDPALSRFISADSVVPGAPDGSLDGVALKPLTVDFHEPGFVTGLNAENGQGFWFQNSDQVAPWGPQNPQALNRYAYVQNNPVRYTDPTGHCPLCVTAAIGAVVGAGIAYGTQVAANIARSGLSTEAFTNVSGSQIVAAAVAGGVAGATGFVGTAILGAGFKASVAIGAISGVASGQAARATANALSGQSLTTGLGKPSDMLLDGATGAIGGALGAGKEIKVGKDWRFAPGGNRSGHPIGEYPHYHRRGSAAPGGKTMPGQGIGRHRPWEQSKHDKSWKDRF